MLYTRMVSCDSCELLTETGIDMEDVQGFLDNAEYEEKLAVLHAAAAALGVQLEIENEQ